MSSNLPSLASSSTDPNGISWIVLVDRAIAEGKTASGIRFEWCLFDFVSCLSMTSDSDDESVRWLLEELLALRKIVKDTEANLSNPPCRNRIHPTNRTARLRPRRGPRKPRSN